MDQSGQVMKGTRVTLCMVHRVPLNRCGCVVSASPTEGPEPIELEGVSDFRERQARVNDQQWLDVADAREGAEWREKWEQYAGRDREPDHWEPEIPGIPWWVIALGATCILIALFGLYVVTHGSRV